MDSPTHTTERTNPPRQKQNTEAAEQAVYVGFLAAAMSAALLSSCAYTKRTRPTVRSSTRVIYEVETDEKKSDIKQHYL